MVSKELEKDIKEFFPKGESERIINLINNYDSFERNSKSSEYQLTRLAVNKLKKAKKLLEYEDIQKIIKRTRR